MIPGLDAFGLLEVYYEVLTRPEPAAPVHTIHRPEVDLAACCRHVLTSLGGVGGRGELGDILAAMATKGQRVITFVATLEMTRLGWFELVQERHLGPVVLRSKVPVDQDLEGVLGSVEEAV